MTVPAAPVLFFPDQHQLLVPLRQILQTQKQPVTS